LLSFHHDEVRAEYDRWIELTKQERAGVGPGLDVQDVLTVHFLIVDMFYR
jgi:hypothetical protein